MQLGFVIDHSRCIGCHACTVACKAENDVPVGSFRTWVKYVEQGAFPQVQRSFAVLRCNQCSDAPCITICPVHALKRRSDGIVDVDPERCIGCKSCLQGCPYDALYINDASGTAEKCHFCAHRTDRGLAPACAIVCPTEAIIPGDFDAPESSVSRIKAAERLVVRRPEAGTRPNVYYRQVDRSAIDPLDAGAAGGYLWADEQPGAQLEAERFWASTGASPGSRTVYDVEHGSAWGGRVSAYLFTKSLAAGSFLAGALLMPPLALGAGMSAAAAARTAGLALFFLLVTTLLLILDLKRPSRFLYILRFPNWSSWLTRGTLVLASYGALLTVWLAPALPGSLPRAARTALLLATAVAAALTAVYTAWLFHQARGRVLWLRATLAPELLAHAVLAGSALLILLAGALGLEEASVQVLRLALAGSLVAQLAFGFPLEGRFAPRARAREYERAGRLITHGPYARRHWGIGIGAGVLLPLLILSMLDGPAARALGAGLALVGMYVEQDVLVRAGQAPRIS